jgi:replicative DNA helicase
VRSDNLNLPADPQLEREILGVCFSEDLGQVRNVRAVLGAEDFALDDHRRVFRSLCRLADAGGPLTITLVHGDLQARSEPVTVEMLIGLEGLPFALDGNLRRAKDLSRRRRLMLRASELLHQAADLTQPIDELVQKAERSLREVHSAEVEATSDDIDSIIQQRGGISGFLEPTVGIPSPWPGLNYTTGGWQRGELALLAARPSMGKTAIALNAVKTAAERGVPSVFYSLEMSRDAILKRLISLHTGITFQDIQRSELNNSERRAVAEALDHLRAIPIRIVQAAGKTALAIRCHADRLKHQGKLEFAAIDYVGLIQGSGSHENRNLEVGDIARQIKEMAGELDIPVLLLSQLNRGPETRPDKRPVLADLRDSGELENHADLVAFLHRPGYYKRDDETLRLKAELIIAKQRNGDTPTLPLLFRRESGRFYSEAREVSEQCA